MPAGPPPTTQQRVVCPCPVSLIHRARQLPASSRVWLRVLRPMVNRVLTSPLLWCFEGGGRTPPVPVLMSQVAPISPPPLRADGRSPFVRLAELLANVKPSRPAITLSVGEPQHPIPSFVGPVIAAHLNDFGRYPANKGTERFRRAAAAWAGRRYDLPRPL